MCFNHLKIPFGEDSDTCELNISSSSPAGSLIPKPSPTLPQHPHSARPFRLHIMDQTVRIPSLITWNSCLSSCAWLGFTRGGWHHGGFKDDDGAYRAPSIKNKF